MPMYEYRCEKCGNIFAIMQSMAEHDRETIRCPKCQGNEVAQLVSQFTPQTSRKS